MSTKEQFIGRLRKARTHHLKWLNQIRLLVSGITADKESIAVNQSESAFGVWFYDEAMAFGNSTSKNVLGEMDKLYGSCFDHYFKIYHTLFSNSSGGFMNAILGPKKPAAGELMMAQKFYEELVVSSDALMGKLRLFESQLLATGEDKFAELMVPETAEEAPIEKPSSGSSVKRMYRGQPID